MQSEARPRRQIVTVRLLLSELDAADLDALVQGAPDGIEAWLGARFPRPFEPPPLMDDALPFMRDEARKRPGDPLARPWFFADLSAGEVIGAAGFSGTETEGAIQIGYSVYPRHQNRGYATEAARALLDFAWSLPNIRAVRATIPPWNTESVRVAEKLGMVLVGEGTDDEVGTIHVYEIEAEREPKPH